MIVIDAIDDLERPGANALLKNLEEPPVGTIFLLVCLIRALRGDFTPKQHFGFEAAAWYWHFVDVVWLFLFFSIYIWGGWGAPVAHM